MILLYQTMPKTCFFATCLLTIMSAANAAPTAPEPTAAWSKENIIALVNVLIPVLLFIMGMFSAKIRRCLCKPYECRTALNFHSYSPLSFPLLLTLLPKQYLSIPETQAPETNSPTQTTKNSMS